MSTDSQLAVQMFEHIALTGADDDDDDDDDVVDDFVLDWDGVQHTIRQLPDEWHNHHGLV